jgi:membrane-associated protein
MDIGFWNFFSDPHHLIEYGGLILILAIVFVETGFFLGFVLPGGDYLLFAAGMFCGTQYLELPLALLLFNILGALTWVCTLVPLGYFAGKAYPDVMKYSICIIIIFIVIASIPMLKIMLSKIKKS